MQGRKPEYPTLLELIRGRAKRAAIAGGSAAVIATAGCSSMGGTGSSDADTYYPEPPAGLLVDPGSMDVGDIPVPDTAEEGIYVVHEIFGGGMPVPDMGWKDEEALIEETKDLPVETDPYIPLAGDMEWDVHEPADPDAKDGT